MERTLAGRRVIVVGASAGIGRAAAAEAIARGADVVVGARRAEALDQLVQEAGGGTAVTVDLADPDSCAAFVSAATAALDGPVDVVLFTAGMAPLDHIEKITAEQWHRTMATNAVSFNLLVAGLLPSLAPAALVAALSSEAVEAPRFGMIAYGASKAALELSLRGWRLEHPEARFSTIVVGATVPTDFGNNFEMDILVKALDIWATQGLAQEQFMDTTDVGVELVDLLETGLAHPNVGMERLVLRSPSGITADASVMHDAATPGDG